MGKHDQLMDRARDELFSHINHCDVLDATSEDQEEWMKDTIQYLAERYPDLDDEGLATLHDVGMRFCKPAISHGSSRSEEVRDAR